MRITVTSGSKQVHIKVKGKSRKKLAAAEATAHRLLTETPTDPDGRPFGFAVASDTERSDQDD